MKQVNKSLFNLIEIFRGAPRQHQHPIDKEVHCAHQQLHDYYCDHKHPFMAVKS